MNAIGMLHFEIPCNNSSRKNMQMLDKLSNTLNKFEIFSSCN